MKSGRDQMVIDPDPDEIYTKRKKRIVNVMMVGYCNHVLALMFKVCKFSLYDSKNTSDLCDEEDEQPDLACTFAAAKVA